MNVQSDSIVTDNTTRQTNSSTKEQNTFTHIREAQQLVRAAAPIDAIREMQPGAELTLIDKDLFEVYRFQNDDWAPSGITKGIKRARIKRLSEVEYSVRLSLTADDWQAECVLWLQVLFGESATYSSLQTQKHLVSTELFAVIKEADVELLSQHLKRVCSKKQPDAPMLTGRTWEYLGVVRLDVIGLEELEFEVKLYRGEHFPDGVWRFEISPNTRDKCTYKALERDYPRKLPPNLVLAKQRQWLEKQLSNCCLESQPLPESHLMICDNYKSWTRQLE